MKGNATYPKDPWAALAVWALQVPPPAEAHFADAVFVVFAVVVVAEPVASVVLADCQSGRYNVAFLVDAAAAAGDVGTAAATVASWSICFVVAQRRAP